MALPTPGVTPANWGAQLNAEIEAAQNLPRRGGVYGSPASAFTASTVTQVVLATESGDSDLISGGVIVIPAGAGGVWSITVTWISRDANAARKFVDLNLNSSAGGSTDEGIYRGSIGTSEDRTTLTTVRTLVAGDTLAVKVFSGSTNAAKVSRTVVDAYRIGP